MTELFGLAEGPPVLPTRDAQCKAELGNLRADAMVWQYGTRNMSLRDSSCASLFRLPQLDLNTPPEKQAAEAAAPRPIAVGQSVALEASRAHVALVKLQSELFDGLHQLGAAGGHAARITDDAIVQIAENTRLADERCLSENADQSSGDDDEGAADSPQATASADDAGSLQGEAASPPATDDTMADDPRAARAEDADDAPPPAPVALPILGAALGAEHGAANKRKHPRHDSTDAGENERENEVSFSSTVAGSRAKADAGAERCDSRGRSGAVGRDIDEGRRPTRRRLDDDLDY